MSWFDRLSAPYKRQATLDELFTFTRSNGQPHSRKRIKQENNQDDRRSPVAASPSRRSSASGDDSPSNIRFESKSTSENDDNISPSSPTRPRLKRRILDSDGEASDSGDQLQDDSSEDELRRGVGIRWRSGTQKTKRVISDSEDESRGAKKNSRKRLMKGSRPSSDEDDDLDENRKFSMLVNRTK